jgi:endonuclease-3 related protein
MFFSAQLPLERISKVREPMLNRKAHAIRLYYETLFSAWGCQHWWPAQSRFEMIVGAYLTQNTAWTNVKKALRNLRAARLLTLDGIRRASIRQLETLIRPSGYFRQKALRLKTFVKFVDKNYDGSLSRMFARPTAELRNELLALNGVGPETADSILLYAGNHPVFVVDAYTRRILERHEIVSQNASYEEIRELCEQGLTLTENAPIKTSSLDPNVDTNFDTNLASAPAPQPVSLVAASGTGPRGACHRPSRVSRAERSQLVQIYNDMHGLIVGVGKNYCLKSQPRCEQCPLQKYLPLPK